MRANFDINHSCYPIGYLRSGDLYLLTDMRTLGPVIPDTVTLDEAAVLAAKINRKLRGGQDIDVSITATELLLEMRG